MNDTIRVELNSKSFLDPYSTLLKFRLWVDPDKMPYFFTQALDTSAHSLISEFRVYSNGALIEDNQAYDTIASILHDLNFSAQYRLSRAYEGHGHSKFSTISMAEPFKANVLSTPVNNSNEDYKHVNSYDPLYGTCILSAEADLNDPFLVQYN
ncbi:MAG: hypothetical protein IPH62_19975 [Ignavibacteriae bacterium]|nr:hypothetical protein [Ignavibacteriota bacterium]